MKLDLFLAALGLRCQRALENCTSAIAGVTVEPAPPCACAYDPRASAFEIIVEANFSDLTEHSASARTELYPADLASRGRRDGVVEALILTLRSAHRFAQAHEARER